MEIQVSGVDGLPDDSLVSIKTGASRRQAQVSQLGPNSKAFSFPTSSSTEDMNIRIDVMKNLGSQNMVLRPEEGIYDVEMGGSNDISLKLGVRGRICEKSHPSPKKVEDNTIPEGLPELSQRGQQHRDYLEDEGVLKLMKSLLAAVVLEQPEDPYSFMAEQFSKAQFTRTEPIRKMETVKDTVVAQGKASKKEDKRPSFDQLSVELQGALQSLAKLSLCGGLPLEEIPQTRNTDKMEAALVTTLNTTGQLASTLLMETPENVETAINNLPFPSSSGQAAISESIQSAIRDLGTLSTSAELVNTLTQSSQADWPENIQSALSTLATVSASAGDVSNDPQTDVLETTATTFNTLTTLSTSAGLANTLATNLQNARSDNVDNAVNTLATLSLSGERIEDLKKPQDDTPEGAHSALAHAVTTLDEDLPITNRRTWPENVQTALHKLAALSLSGEGPPENIETALSALASLNPSPKSDTQTQTNIEVPENVQTALGTLASLSPSGETSPSNAKARRRGMPKEIPVLPAHSVLAPCTVRSYEVSMTDREFFFLPQESKPTESTDTKTGISLMDCAAMALTASIGDLECALSGLSTNNKERLAEIFSSNTDVAPAKTLKEYLVAAVDANLSDVEAAISSLTADDVKKLRTIFMSDEAKTLLEYATKAASANNDDIAVVLATFTVDVQRKLVDALSGKVPKAPLKETPEANKVIVTFEPGKPLGIIVHDGIVSKIKEGGQGEREGIKKGWRIIACMDQPCYTFHDKCFEDCKAGSTPFQATFDNSEEVDDTAKEMKKLGKEMKKKLFEATADEPLSPQAKIRERMHSEKELVKD